MLINPAPLAQTVSLLREGSRDLANYVDEMCDRVDAVDPDIQALLPEPGRRNGCAPRQPAWKGAIHSQPAGRRCTVRWWPSRIFSMSTAS